MSKEILIISLLIQTTAFPIQTTLYVPFQFCDVAQILLRHY